VWIEQATKFDLVVNLKTARTSRHRVTDLDSPTCRRPDRNMLTHACRLLWCMSPL